MFIYFILNAKDEMKAVKELEFIFNKKINNEGHNESGLHCFFYAESLEVKYLYAILKRQSECLDCCNFHLLSFEGKVSQFELVEHPGMSQPIQFEDWLDYLEEKGL